jgi:hypothetical protein
LEKSIWKNREEKQSKVLFQTAIICMNGESVIGEMFSNQSG